MGEIAVLRCESCGSPVPLRDGDDTVCARCDRSVPIPAAHRQLRDLDRADTAARAEAEAQARRIVPAGRALRAVAWVVDSGVYPALTLLLVPVLGLVPLVSLFFFAEKTRSLLGFDLLDLGRTTGALFLAFFSLALCVGAVPIVAVFGRRRARSRLTLLRSLAARPLESGSTLACRNCGAPLELDSSELVERCVYCRTDNLRLPGRAELERRTAEHSTFQRTLAEAVAADDKERSEIARAARRGIAWVSTPVVALTLLGAVIDLTDSTTPWWFSAAFEEPRELRYGGCNGRRPPYEVCFPRKVEPGSAVTVPHYPSLRMPAAFTLPMVAQGVSATHSIALRRGERLRVRVVPHQDPSIPSVVSASARGAGHRFDVRLGQDSVSVGLDEPTEWVVPWHGWFHVEVVSDAPVAARVELELIARQ